MISIENLYVEFAARPLFDQVSFLVNHKDRIALVGKNGAGKSTLLKIIAGIQVPTSGVVSIPRDVKVGYLPQVMNFSDNRTVYDEAAQAFTELTKANEELNRLQEELSNRTDYESETYMQLVDAYTQKNEHFQLLGGLNYQSELERTLQGLGFSRTDFTRQTSEFSGGWRMRIELAKILLQKPDILLLDEPTNHLDIESIQWLEQFLVNNAKTVILVSHDRAFINNVTQRTLEISCGKIYDYKVKYDEYVSLRKERREQQLRAYENQQKEMAEIRAFIERFRYQATKAIQVQSRIKQLERMVPIEVDEEDHSALRLKFTCSMRSGDFPLICDEVAKQYGTHQVFKQVNFTIRRGEKVAFVGKNGEGKSTLVKCIQQEIPFEGNVKVGHQVQIGYFAQNQAQLLDGELTVFDTIDQIAKGDIRLKIRDILGAFMFGGEASDKKVKFLSGGERTRLAMIKLLLQPVNFLILDEPTNHLDMRSKDVLKAALKDFDGTVIVVSHDREFLDGLVEKVYEFGGGQVKEHIGGIYDFLRKKQAERDENISWSVDSLTNDMSSLFQTSQTGASSASIAQEKSASKLDYEKQKELNKKIRKAAQKVEECEKAIAELEAAVAIIEGQLATPEGASDESLYLKYQNLQNQLNTQMEQWDEAITACEELKKM